MGNGSGNAIDESAFKEGQAASFLGVSVATLRRWRLMGQGPRYLKYPGAVRYLRDELAEFRSSCLRR